MSSLTPERVAHDLVVPPLENGDLLTRDEFERRFQPDWILMIAPERGGRTRISKDGFVESAPELVV